MQEADTPPPAYGDAVIEPCLRPQQNTTTVEKESISVVTHRLPFRGQMVHLCATDWLAGYMDKMSILIL